MENAPCQINMKYTLILKPTKNQVFNEFEWNFQYLLNEYWNYLWKDDYLKKSVEIFLNFIRLTQWVPGHDQDVYI